MLWNNHYFGTSKCRLSIRDNLCKWCLDVAVVNSYLQMDGILLHALGMSTDTLVLKSISICKGHAIPESNSIYPRFEDNMPIHCTVIGTYLQVDGLCEHSLGMWTTYLRLKDNYMYINHTISITHCTYPRVEDKWSANFSIIDTYQQVYGTSGHAVQMTMF